ncbi:tRNA 2-thiocytidine biosynthesis protein TtcA, partial [Armadillidium nasatum]
KIEEFTRSTPEIVPLGNVSFSSRLPILSFLVKHPPSGKYLHYNFISALLNDIFGIQSRGGCACAGPYAQDLLGIDEVLAQRYEKILLENTSLDRSHLRRKEEHGNLDVLRPGFVRINLPFTASDEQVNFIFKSVKEVCKSGWKLLPQYIFNPETGEWKHYSNLVFKSRQWLQNISYSKGYFDPNLKSESFLLPSYDKMLWRGEDLFRESVKIGLRMNVPDQRVLFEGEAEELRWFLLPVEGQKYMRNNIETKTSSFRIPFTPLIYPLDDDILNARPNYVWSGNEFKNKQISFSNIKNDKLSSESELTNCLNGSCFVQRKTEDNVRDIFGISQAKPRWVSPPKSIFNPTVEALESFSMIQPDDKVLVCLSGGKDSLSLLHTLRQYQYYSRSKNLSFSLGAVTVDPLSTSYDPRPLIPYLKSLGIPYFYEEQDILKQAMGMDSLNSICSFCSRLKRGRIYASARREGYNVLAMGQHLDDLAESFLMSVFHNGREGDLRVIRPFIYVREKELRDFAESKKLPIIPENCPGCFESPKERHRVKQLLAQQEVLFPSLFWSLKRALVPLFSIGKTGLENSLFGKNCFANPAHRQFLY